MSFREHLVAPRRRLALVALGAALSVAAVGCGSDSADGQATTTTGVGASSTTTIAIAPTTETSTTSETTDPAAPTGPEGSDAPGGPTTVTGADRLREPSGTFLSSHRLSLSGNDGPATARSVCHTTAGATCEITFSKNGMNVSLAAKEADGGGVTTWDWSPGAMTMDAGRWDVVVTARLDGAEKSVTDPIGLEVVD